MKRQIYNSTIGVIKKTCRICGKKDYIFSRGRCKQCATIEDTKKRFDNTLDEEDEGDDLSSLIQDLDTVISRYIRLKYADNNGIVSCFTCDAPPQHFSRMQCGHYIPRTHLATRFLETNLRVQCEKCNCYLNGNIELFRERLEKESPGITEWLWEQSRLITKPSRFELKELLITYRQKLKLVQSKLKK